MGERVSTMTGVVLGEATDEYGNPAGAVDRGWAEDMAETLYSLTAGIDDRRRRAAVIAEMTDWLRDGDLRPGELVDAQHLADQWREYAVASEGV